MAFDDRPAELLFLVVVALVLTAAIPIVGKLGLSGWGLRGNR